MVARLASGRTLLAFDFDGTLAPIVSDRHLARMRPRTARLFFEACERYPCAVISGRSRSDILPRIAPARARHVVGNHGIERGGALSPVAKDVAESRAFLHSSLAHLAGVEIEDKIHSLSVHYRRAPCEAAARDEILGATNRLPMPMRVVGGKLVINLIPAGAPNKGDAVVALHAAEAAESTLYVGDDITDEDVFVRGEPGLVSVRVGASRESAAPYFLRTQKEIDALLRALIVRRAERITS